MRNRNLFVALMFVGSTAAAGFALAEVTTPPAPTQSHINLDDVKDGAKVESAEMQHLRAARKLIEDAKSTFDKDPADKADHRKEALEGIDKAIKALDDEIVEYKADMTQK